MRNQNTLVRAETAMKDNRYGDAIDLFTAHLDTEPGDLKALLHLGICHLLNRSEPIFLFIYDEAVKLKQTLGEIPKDVSRIFAQYEGLVKKVTAAALVVGTMSAAGCGDDNDGPFSSHKYSGGVNLSPDAAASSDEENEDVGTDTVTSAHRYSGGVALNPVVLDPQKE